MTEELQKKLLQDKHVIEEINRHLWLESEKAGYDIGFQAATDDWLKRFSKAWMDYHWPKARQVSTPAVSKIKKSYVKTRIAVHAAK